MSARESFQVGKASLFNSLLKQFKNNSAETNAFINGLTISQGELRLEVKLSITSAGFSFGVNPNQANSNNLQFPTENRLNVNDAFVANEYGIFIAKTTGDDDKAFRPRTYGNRQVFTVAGEADAVDNNFYGTGSFGLKANGETLIPYRGLWNHFYEPQTQQTDALGSASPGDMIRGAEDGFITIEPNLTLRGDVTYVPQIVLGSAMAAATNVRVILIFRGILAQNIKG